MKRGHLFFDLRQKAQELKHKIYTLYLAYKDPRTPWYARVFCIFVLAYALSPIDLIPDFIPFLGQLDDLILIPLGMKFAISMIPGEVMNDCNLRAGSEIKGDKVFKWVGTAVIILFWLILIALAVQTGITIFAHFQSTRG